jgi:hypothetical protein
MDSFVLSETLKYLYLLFAKPEELYLGKLEFYSPYIYRFVSYEKFSFVDPYPLRF